MSKAIQNTNAVPLSFKNSIVLIFKAVAVSYIISLVLLLPTTLLAVLQAFSDKGIYIAANIITAFGTAVAGFIVGRRVGGKGIFFGACSGIIYTLFLCVVGNIIAETGAVGTSCLTAAVIGILCGAVGGIAGINTQSNKHR